MTNVVINEDPESLFSEHTVSDDWIGGCFALNMMDER